MEREGRPDRTPASSRVAVVALLVVIAAAAAPARAETLGPAGGDGGTAKVSGCGTMAETTSTGSMATPVHYVVGVAMRHGGWIDQIRAICATLVSGGAAGSRWSSPLRDGQAIGGTGGQPKSRMCPRGQVVVAMRGRAGAYVDSLRIGCRAIAWVAPFTVKATGPTTWLDAVGGTGGKAFGPLRCGNGGVVETLSGKGGAYLDSLSMGCADKVETWKPDHGV